ncbi:MAG: fibro-slime domain-containing protein [Bacteroidia bacterium]|nr:fibro-slime domain-containing protein [Bacteroidia bacterium]
MSTTVDLTFTFSAGFYTSTNNPYFPIENQLFGNEGREHNYSFTSEIVAYFHYNPGQTIQIASDDDCLIFINGKLIYDRMGIILGGTGLVSINMDTVGAGIGLEVGKGYVIRIFHAERYPSNSAFTIYTSFKMEDYMVALSHWIIGSGTLTPAAGAYVPGGSQVITATPSSGYELASLTLNGSAILSGSTQVLSDHATVAAIFTRDLKMIHSCTRDEIIAAALRKCQVLAEGELPTNDQISTGAEALERFMQHSQSDCEFRWQFLQRTQAVAADEQTLTLTGSEDILDVYDLFLRDANGMDIPLRLVDAHWYDSTLAAKSTSGALPAVALATFNRDPDTNVASVSLSIYPKPAQAYTLYYRAMIKHYLLENGTDEANFDEMWCEVVVYGLAARLADEYNRTDRAVYLEQKFEKLKDAAKRKTGASRDSLVVFSV